MPSQLHVITSNHLEELADALSEIVLTFPDDQPLDPLKPEIIVVQSKGMRDWIRMALAQRNGVCANTRFPFPNTFIEQLYAGTVGPLPDQHYFDPAILTFRIMHMLSDLMSHGAFDPIKRYLHDDPHGVNAYRISRKIADLYDQYMVFRPEMIAEWQNDSSRVSDKDQKWQAILWKRLVDAVDSPHRAEIQKGLTTRLSGKPMKNNEMPNRVSIFGVSHLPPFHLSVLAALANQIPVYLFLLDPCRHYWSDIMSEQQIMRAISRHGVLSDEGERALHLDQGNRLLASWGHHGKQFFDLIHQLEGQRHEIVIDEPRHTLLACIQDDILNLNDGPSNARSPNEQNDGSVQIHICHSPMREVEILHDQLLFMLDSDPDLEPRDILVMTPDIETYAPLIQAVFSAPVDGQGAIPYSVSDRNVPSESQLVKGFLQLLDLHRSRFEVTKIIHLLEFPAIRERFQISESDIERIERWVDGVTIRWGWDGHDRAKHGLPRFETNTWRQGLDRLILGYAMRDDGNRLVEGILPFTGLDISDGRLLGNFIDFAESVHQAIEKIGKPATMDRWHGIVCHLIDTFIAANESSGRDLKVLKEAVDELEQVSAWVTSDRQISFEVVREVITHALGRTAYGTGFLTGSVTFCAMLPMRSIPAKVICLMGMGHDQFPRESKEPTFNLIAAHPRAGDRSKRDDDKYLFLESLISSRKVFYMSYVGRDIQDNSAIPPSVVVDELIEYAQDCYGIAREQLVIEHPLQAFSRSYFDQRDDRLFSYSKRNFEASKLVGGKGEIEPFFRRPLPAAKAVEDACDLRQLNAFFSHPCRYLAEQRLGIYLHETVQALDDREKFNLDALDRYRVSQKLLESALQRVDVEQAYQVLQAGGELPHGASGKASHRQLQREIDAFIQVLNAYSPGVEPTTASIETRIGDYTIRADLTGIYPELRLIYRMARARPRDVLCTFIDHLAMLSVVAHETQLPASSLLICTDAIWQFGPIPDAEDVLADYLTLFIQGQQYPLPFFSNTSYVYAESLLMRKLSSRKSLAAAAKKFQGGYHVPAAEKQDPYIRLCFRGIETLNKAFEQTAIRIYKPMFSYGSRKNP